MIEQFKELIKNLSWSDISWTHRYGIKSQYCAQFPTEIEVLRSAIQGTTKPGSLDWHCWQFYFKDIYQPLNRIHFQHGIPKVLRGIGFGTKLYRSLIQHLGYASSEPNSSEMATKVWQKLVLDNSLKTYQHNGWTLCIADPKLEKVALQTWQSALRSELGLVIQESLTKVDSIWRTTSSEWLDNLINKGWIQTHGKKFISLSHEQDSGGQDNYGDVTIQFNKDLLDQQGLIDVWYEPKFFEKFPDVCKHITGFRNETEYYSNLGVKSKQEAWNQGQLSWEDLIESYQDEAELVIEKIVLVPNLIISVTGNASKSAQNWLKSHKIGFKP